MKYSVLSLTLLGAAAARPAVNVFNFEKREVPQEHAHRNVNLEVAKLLALNNPDNISDPVFGLLGAKAAAEGAGSIADPDCLQQATADQAFTNAKAAGDVNGMTFALIYRALERNTGSVGLASVPCTSIKAVNPEIAALSQHQDPASAGAAEGNKKIAQTLAAQIGTIGGDPALANEASTFAPGQVGDPTARGNTCNDQADDKGCINTLNLRVDDLTADEILVAVGGAAANATKPAAPTQGQGQAAQGQAAQGQAAAGGMATASGTADFGSCPDATIKFGAASDGRQGDAFEASDLANFPHGSALNIGVISGFICDQLVNKCKANAAAVATCNQAEAASKALKGQAAADAFNSAIQA